MLAGIPSNAIETGFAISTSSTSHSALSSSTQGQDLIEIDLVGSILRNWLLIAVFAFLGAAAAIAYALLTPVIYESRAQIMVIPKDSTLPMETVQGSLGFDRPDSVELLATHAQVIQSPRIVLEGLTNRGLVDLPSVQPHLTKKVDQIDYIIGGLKVTRGGEGAAKTAQVLDVSFRHTDAEDCSQILESIIHSYQSFLASTAKSAGSEAAELISEKSNEISQKLLTEENAYRKFREDAPVLFNQGETVNVHQAAVADLEKSLSDLRLRQTAVQSRLNIVTEALKPENADEFSDLERFALIDQEDIGRLTLLVSVERGDTQSEVFLASQPQRAELARTEYGKLMELKLEAGTLGEAHPRFAQLQSQIAEYENLMSSDSGTGTLDDKAFNLGELTNAYKSLLKHDLQDIGERITEYKNIIDQERDKAKSLIAYEIKEKQLSSQVLRTKTLFDAVIDRLREINLAKEYGGFITEVIEPVQLGEEAWPKRTLLAVLGFLGGGVLGCFVSVLKHFTDESFHGVNDIVTTLDLPLLANLPNVQRKRRQRSDSTFRIQLFRTTPRDLQPTKIFANFEHSSAGRPLA